MYQLGDRVILKSERFSVNRQNPAWNSSIGKVIGTIVSIQKPVGEALQVGVFWDSFVNQLSSKKYMNCEEFIIKINPLMVPIGTKVYLKDYSPFPLGSEKLGKVVLRSVRYGVKVKIGRIEKYINVNNIIIDNKISHSKCIYCGIDIDVKDSKVSFIEGFFAHTTCSKKCISCGNSPVVKFDRIHPTINLCSSCKRRYYLPCSKCGKDYTISNLHALGDDKYLCYSCLEKYMTRCYKCGRHVEQGTLITVAGKGVCKNCCQRFVRICSHCGKKHFNHIKYNEEIYCIDCREKLFTHCRRCGNYVLILELGDITISGETFTKICLSCRNVLEESLYINKWNYKPNKYYYSKMKYEKNPLYLGLELEIELNKKSSVEGAKETLEIIRSLGVEKYFFLKQDGSLKRGASFELVGQPATLSFIGSNYKIYELLKFFIASKYDCTKSGRCGLHVHISNKDLSFEDMAKIKMFLWKHRDLLSIFGNKASGINNRYARFEKYGIYEYKHRRMINHEQSKYIACNLTKNTLEFRFWKATFDHLRFISTLTFSEAIAYYVKDASLAKIHYGKFKDFVEWIYKSEYFHLLKYFQLLNLVEKEKEMEKDNSEKVPDKKEVEDIPLNAYEPLRFDYGSREGAFVREIGSTINISREGIEDLGEII